MSCDKNTLRRMMIQKRKAEGKKENGYIIADKIRLLPEYKNARTVMLYMPILNEADITALIKDEKTFLVPVTDGDEIYSALVTGEFENGKFNVPEPCTKEAFDKSKIDLVIVPGVAFDKKFNRMGYGKGYYDRFLKDMNVFKIGVCHSFQLIAEISAQEHDVKMDMIVTEDNLWRKGNISSV